MQGVNGDANGAADGPSKEGSSGSHEDSADSGGGGDPPGLATDVVLEALNDAELSGLLTVLHVERSEHELSNTQVRRPAQPARWVPGVGFIGGPGPEHE